QHRRALASGPGMDAGLYPQRRTHGLVLFRSHHSRICRGYLEGASARRVVAPGTRGPARDHTLTRMASDHRSIPSDQNAHKLSNGGADHLFDQATRVSAGDSRWQGQTSADYWAFVGPFGGATAATILRALMDHPQATGDPLAVTVNYCAPIAKGPFDLDVRLVKANRFSLHWSVALAQGGGECATRR